MQCLKRILLTRYVYNNVEQCLKSGTRSISTKVNIRNYGLYPMATNMFNQRFLRICNTYSSVFSTAVEGSAVDAITFEKVCEETLESLSDYFEQIIESDTHLKEADVSYSSGVLTVSFGKPYGTYVINRQSPNRQIWLSSPTSGPKRYDFLPNTESWVYKHNGENLHELLQLEIEKIIKNKINFKSCLFS